MSSPQKNFEFFATTPKGLELLLVDELKALGAKDAAEKLAGVSFSGDLSLAYQACLWSRLANRILLKLASFPARTPEALYEGVKKIAWEDHFSLDKTIAVHFVSVQSEITHTLYGAQTVKDAIVDQFREKYDDRPSVMRDRPDISIHVYLHRDVANVSIDLSGESLHKRGYRLSGGKAPLKENLAAAILLRAGWMKSAEEGAVLLDPMCGSATFLIEGAMMAADIAPGLGRDYFGFEAWKKHDPECFLKLREEAALRKAKGLERLPKIIGYDQDPEAIQNAFENIERAGFLGKIHVEKRELDQFSANPNFSQGLVVTNPPYGERLGEIHELESLYRLLGDRLRTFPSSYRAAVFTGNPDLGKVMGIRAIKFYALFNGSIPCKLLLFHLLPEKFVNDPSRRADPGF